MNTEKRKLAPIPAEFTSMFMDIPKSKDFTWTDK